MIIFGAAGERTLSCDLQLLQLRAEHLPRVKHSPSGSSLLSNFGGTRSWEKRSSCRGLCWEKCHHLVRCCSSRVPSSSRRADSNNQPPLSPKEKKNPECTYNIHWKVHGQMMAGNCRWAKSQWETGRKKSSRPIHAQVWRGVAEQPISEETLFPGDSSHAIFFIIHSSPWTGSHHKSLVPPLTQRSYSSYMYVGLQVCVCVCVCVCVWGSVVWQLCVKLITE